MANSYCKISILLFSCFTSLTLLGQLNCENLELVGIYSNNVNTDQLSLLVTNRSLSHDGNENVYTALKIVNDDNDTIVLSNAVHSLPNSIIDTIVYNISLHEKYDDIYDLPYYNSGHFITAYPDCEGDFTFPNNEIGVLPFTTHLDCSDFKIVGLYDTAHGGNHNYSLILTNTNKDSLRNWDFAYTTFQFFDSFDNSLCEATTPSYMVPAHYGDTVIVHLEFHSQFIENKDLVLKMLAPDCLVPFTFKIPTNTLDTSLKSLHIYPNPSLHYVQIPNELQFEYYILMDLEGKIVLSGSNHKIDLSKVERGTYHLMVKSGSSKYVDKIVKL